MGLEPGQKVIRGTQIDDQGVLIGPTHKFGPKEVHHLKLGGLLWQLLLNLRGIENAL